MNYYYFQKKWLRTWKKNTLLWNLFILRFTQIPKQCWDFGSYLSVRVASCPVALLTVTFLARAAASVAIFQNNFKPRKYKPDSEKSSILRPVYASRDTGWPYIKMPFLWYFPQFLRLRPPFTCQTTMHRDGVIIMYTITHGNFHGGSEIHLNELHHRVNIFVRR